ncbi:MAG: SDR family oxidoreductase [Parvularculaceae bacterium]|nr:SDR family oxidoreductase [Parvularculaceae bacterium]
MGRVEGKKAFITGGAQGLGACFGRMLAAEGAKVFLTDVNVADAEKTASEIDRAYPGAASFCHHDVTRKEDWENALAMAAEFMGGVSVLINNAGVGGWGNIETETPENWRRTLNIDVDSIYVGTQLAMPYLKESQPASIINISSVAGMIAHSEMLSYNTAKAAVWMMSKSIALHCARQGYDIRSNSVHPAFTRTPIIDPLVTMGGGGAEGETKLTRQIPLQRLGEPEDVGYAVLYLASDESRFVTASEFKIDGGITAQ